jgi:hypothetical protein
VAIVRIVTKEEQEAEGRSRFRLVCEGVSKEEFTDFMKACERFECKIALRNPFPGAFTPKDVHEIISRDRQRDWRGCGKESRRFRQRAARRLREV